MYNVTSSTDIEMYVHAALGEFEGKLERLLFVREPERSEPVKYDLTQFPEISELVSTQRNGCVKQYREHMILLNNYGRGRRQQVTIKLYMQKLEVYRKIFENKLNCILKDVERRLTTELQGLEAA